MTLKRVTTVEYNSKQATEFQMIRGSKPVKKSLLSHFIFTLSVS